MKTKSLFIALAGFIIGTEIVSVRDVLAADNIVSAPAAMSVLSLSDCHVKHITSLSKCAMFEVPENWQEPDGEKISLFVAVVPPSGGQAVKTPLYVLAGGPGQSASSLGRTVDIALERARRGREVVLIDQRGTGKSTPFECTFDIDSNPDGALFARNCLETTDNRPQYFSSAEFMQDIDAVRGALGHEQIVLWGGSYGTRAALLYVRAFPDNVEAMILDAVAAPATPYFRLSHETASRALEKLFDNCQADTGCAKAFPDLRSSIRSIKTSLQESPLNLGTGYSKVDADMFMNTLRNALYSQHTTALVPYVVNEFANGNTAPWRAIGDSAFAVFEDMSLGAMLSVICAEELPRASTTSIREAAGDGAFADIAMDFWFDACAAWPAADYPDNYEAVVASDIPTLLFSGELDPVTPPAFGETAMAGLSNARHVIAKHNGHISSATGCAPRLVAEFLDSKDPQALDISCMDRAHAKPFVLGLSGPRP